MLIGMHKMIPIDATNLVPGRRYYIWRLAPYLGQCNKFRGRFTENSEVGGFITSYFDGVLSVTPSLAHTHTYPTFMLLHLNYRYYECSQDRAEEAREKRKNAAIFNEQFNEKLREITGDPWFHLANIPYTQVTKLGH